MSERERYFIDRVQSWLDEMMANEPEIRNSKKIVQVRACDLKGRFPSYQDIAFGEFQTKLSDAFRSEQALNGLKSTLENASFWVEKLENLWEREAEHMKRVCLITISCVRCSTENNLHLNESLYAVYQGSNGVAEIFVDFGTFTSSKLAKEGKNIFRLYEERGAQLLEDLGAS